MICTLSTLTHVDCVVLYLLSCFSLKWIICIYSEVNNRKTDMFFDDMKILVSVFLLLLVDSFVNFIAENAQNEEIESDCF